MSFAKLCKAYSGALYKLPHRTLTNLAMKTIATSELKSHLNWSLTSDEIKAKADNLIARLGEGYDSIGKLEASECQFDNVIHKLGLLENLESTESASLTFPQYVSTDNSVRDASAEADRRLREFAIESSMREDLYKVVAAAVKNSDLTKLSPERQRLAEKLELDFKRHGLTLPKDKQEKLKDLKKKLSELQINFSKNINEDKTECLFSAEELAGLPQDFLKGLSQKDGKYVVTMKYPEFNPCMKLGKSAQTRETLENAYGSRCRDNVGILEKAIALRTELAQLLGYNTHSDFKLEVNMAKDPKTVEKFLRDLRDRLEALGHRELETLLSLKRSDDPNATSIESYDYRFYHNRLLEDKYNVDEQLISQYFSMEAVTKGMLDLYAELLSLEFALVKDAPVWHPDVQLVQVNDAKSGTAIGQFYLDLYPRDGKYTHAACFGLQPGCLVDGKRQRPIAAMVANFTKPTAEKPSLLRHEEVVTYYHELGHVIHQLAAATEFARFHGTNVETDFVEAPSQMLENWCWEPEILERLSSHHETGQKLPKNLVDALCKTRNVGVALFNLRQLFFATFDLTCHYRSDSSPLDTSALWAKLRKEVSLLPSNPKLFPAATFGHIMGGYDSQYYSYLWSQVFSADMFFSRFKSEGLTNGNTGMDYRTKVLGPGGSRDGMALLESFLGRKPSNEAFLKSLGI